MLPAPLGLSLLFNVFICHFQSPVPNSVLQVAVVQVAVAQAVAQAATPDRCYCCFLPGSYFEHPMLRSFQQSKGTPNNTLKISAFKWQGGREEGRRRNTTPLLQDVQSPVRGEPMPAANEK